VCAVRRNCAEKNIRVAEKYYKFGWDSASRQKIGGGEAQVNKIRRGGARRRRRGLDTAA